MNVSLRGRIRGGELTIGAWSILGHPGIAEILAKAGYDWIVVDLEHSTTAIDTAGEMIRVIDLSGSSAFVRLTSNNQDQVKRVMDAGAAGIVVPMVNSPEEAARAVASVHYAPRGTRGVGLGRAQGYGARFQEYMGWEREGPIVIVQIEHRDALPRLESILKVPGVDGLLIGPYDLSCSLGCPGMFDRPEFLGAMEHIKTIARATNCAAGIHVVEPDLKRLTQAVQEGYKLIAYSADIRILDVGAREGLKALKSART